jgi:gamma-glutamyl hercynylcysteine S-oxide synthase
MHTRGLVIIRRCCHGRSTPMSEPRHLTGNALADALRESRARTMSLVADLSDAQWLPPQRPGVNPVAWELAHLAWFAEFWVLRGPHTRDVHGHATAHTPARIAGPDALFDSARLAHAARWSAPLPARDALARTLQEQLDACIDALPASFDDEAHYFHRLALFHEDMHGEALCWLRASTGAAAPRGIAVPHVATAVPIEVRGGVFHLGAGASAPGFAFDNERPGREVRLRDFEIDSTPVSAAAFARFVDAGGYDDAALWPGAAGTWRAQSALSHPQRWRRAERSEQREHGEHSERGARSEHSEHGTPDAAPGDWQHRWFDRWLPLDPHMPAMHLNAFEAEAYCRWAGRRLPSAAEWEAAAPRTAWGHGVWEWTADAFAPYPGFVPGPYLEYSAPWFSGDHRELRGGAFATQARLHDRRYRNFFEPQRTDIFAGLRTAAC